MNRLQEPKNTRRSGAQRRSPGLRASGSAADRSPAWKTYHTKTCRRTQGSTRSSFSVEEMCATGVTARFVHQPRAAAALRLLSSQLAPNNNARMRQKDDCDAQLNCTPLKEKRARFLIVFIYLFRQPSIFTRARSDSSNQSPHDDSPPSSS